MRALILPLAVNGAGFFLLAAVVAWCGGRIRSELAKINAIGTELLKRTGGAETAAAPPPAPRVEAAENCPASLPADAPPQPAAACAAPNPEIQRPRAFADLRALFRDQLA